LAELVRTARLICWLTGRPPCARPGWSMRSGWSPA